MPLLETLTTGSLAFMKKILFSTIMDEAKNNFSRLKKMRLWYKLTRELKDEDIRISMAYLYRIKIDSRYLLVKGNRLDQYQPVGGVYKYNPDAGKLFRKLGVKEDDRLPVDDASRLDLRVRVKGKNAFALLGWFYSRQDRETQQWREFYEELVATNILTVENFPYVNCEHMYTVKHELKKSSHFNCWEILVHEYYDLLPTVQQEQELRALLQAEPNEKFVWTEERLMLALGRDNISQSKPYAVAETAKYLICND